VNRALVRPSGCEIVVAIPWSGTEWEIDVR
jgi:hypothetical protein